MVQALLLGTIGGAIFNAFNLPLPWMLGAMLFTSSAAIAGVRIVVPLGLRGPMVVVLGIMLGSAFDPSILANIERWATSLAGLALYILVCIGLGLIYLRLVSRYDPTTAFFTATPGGFNEMVMMGGAMGGDDRIIAMSHSMRVTLVIMTIPVLFQVFGGLDPAARSAANGVASDIAWRDLALLSGCVLGAPIAQFLRLPAATLIGPMVLSAALHLAGWTDARPPFALIAAAQIIVGSSVGGRFSGIRARHVARAALIASGLTVILLCTTVAFALVLNRITGIGVRDLILAYSPGGLAEMSLVSLALGGDAAFVSTHHIMRIIMIVAFAPALFGLVRRLTRSPPSQED